MNEQKEETQNYYVNHTNKTTHSFFLYRQQFYRTVFIYIYVYKFNINIYIYTYIYLSALVFLSHTRYFITFYLCYIRTRFITFSRQQLKGLTLNVYLEKQEPTQLLNIHSKVWFNGINNTRDKKIKYVH